MLRFQINSDLEESRRSVGTGKVLSAVEKGGFRLFFYRLSDDLSLHIDCDLPGNHNEMPRINFQNWGIGSRSLMLLGFRWPAFERVLRSVWQIFHRLLSFN